LTTRMRRAIDGRHGERVRDDRDDTGGRVGEAGETKSDRETERLRDDEVGDRSRMTRSEN